MTIWVKPLSIPWRILGVPRQGSSYSKSVSQFLGGYLQLDRLEDLRAKYDSQFLGGYLDPVDSRSRRNLYPLNSLADT